MWKMGSVQNAECRKRGVWKMRSEEVLKLRSADKMPNAELMRSVENVECGRCGVWEMRSEENAECRKCKVWKMRSAEKMEYRKCVLMMVVDVKLQLLKS